MYFKVSVMIISAIFYGIGRHEEISKSIGQNDGIVYRAVHSPCVWHAKPSTTPSIIQHCKEGVNLLATLGAMRFLIG